MPVYEAPLDHELSDRELELAVAFAIRDPQFNPGMGHPFNAEGHYFVNCLLGQQRAALEAGRIFDANGGNSRLSFRILELCWSWSLVGILVPAGGVPVGQFVPTARGFEFLGDLGGDEALPYLRTAFADSLRGRCPGIDDITLKYAEQSQACFMAGFYEAAVVLLGAASETALVRLVEAANAKRAVLQTAEIPTWPASQMVDQTANVLRQSNRSVKAALRGAGKDHRWVDDLPALLGGANAIRLTRNDAGHPQRLLVRRDECFGLLTLFPHLAEAIVATSIAIESLA